MRRRLIASITLICFGGCTSASTIGRRDALDNEAEIVQSDANTLYVRAKNGRIYPIGRDSVESIDHPGNVEIIVGAILIGLVAFQFIEARTRNDNDQLAPVALIFGAPALALILSGTARYVPSVRAARAFETADSRVHPLPAAGQGLPPSPYPPPPATAPPAAPPPGIAPPAPPPQPDDEEPQVVPGAT